ncbi:MAG: hypothetical protein EKK55_25025 [Rhodocyclaceae bacterium]|nr:MAG: hypothetical protein EKK55_25025 [Rhodocyclaceae bacterium]
MGDGGDLSDGTAAAILHGVKTDRAIFGFALVKQLIARGVTEESAITAELGKHGYGPTTALNLINLVRGS